MATRRRPSITGRGVPSGDIKQNFKVGVRIRPSLAREKKAKSVQCVAWDSANDTVIISKPSERRSGSSSLLTIDVSDFGERLSVSDKFNTQSFTYDQIFDPSDGQEAVYQSCVAEVTMSVLEGYNGSIIAYGQTGTGKTYTIEGGDGEMRGIIPRATEEIFRYIQNSASPSSKFLVRVSYLEIYNERISDLIDPSRKDLRVREDGEGGVYVESLSEHVVRDVAGVQQLMKKGGALRTTDSTRMNLVSSRSHAVFTIVIEHSEKNENGAVVTVGKLRLVDLAGSERFEADAKFKHQEETKNINTSLYMFGKVVLALTTPGTTHIPYRDSKLTRILQDSLGGNCKTTLIATISPMSISYLESLNSLKFAKRAKAIKNKAIVNQDEKHQALLSVYEKEIRRLKSELAATKEGFIDRDELDRLEEEKRRAEKEKDKVLSELYAQQREVNKALAEKEEYVRQIRELEAKVLYGGRRIEDTEEFQEAIRAEQLRLERGAEERLAELERERNRLEEERAQLERERRLFVETASIRSAPDGGHSESDDEKKSNSVSPSDSSQSFGYGGSPMRPNPPSVPPPLSHSVRRFGVGASYNSPLARRSDVPTWTRPTTTGAADIVSSPRSSRLQRWHSFQGGPHDGYARSHSVHGYYGAGSSQDAYYYEDRDSTWNEDSQWSVPDAESLTRYAMALSHPLTGIPVKIGPGREAAFTGFAAAKWFMSNMEGITSLDSAQDVGQRLMDLDVFASITGAPVFVVSDSDFHYFPNHYRHGGGHRRSQSAFALSSLPNSRPTTASSLHTSSRAPVSSAESMQTSQISLTSITASDWASTQSQRLMTSSRKKEASSSPRESAASLLMARSESRASTSSENSAEWIFEELEWDDFGSSNLHTAAGRGDRRKLSSLVKQYGVNHRDSFGRTALMYAVVGGHVKCCQMLIRQKADVNAVDRLGMSALLLAAQHNRDEVLKLLLKHPQLNLSGSDERSQNVFHVCASAKQTRCLEILARRGPAFSSKAINHLNGSYQSPLHIAVKCQRSEHVRLLLMSQAKLSVGDERGRTALHLAVSENALTCIQAILEISPSDINLVDKSGRSALHLACAEGTMEAVSLLLACRFCSVDLKDGSLESPLHLATLRNRLDIIEGLLQRGAKVMTRDASGKTALQQALDKGFKECAELLKVKE
eukprot:m.20793 g.20793  ORF g.20793 m.20793 type:complete len:1170 (+) comp28085_c0_seq1:96-3605(+)